MKISIFKKYPHKPHHKKGVEIKWKFKEKYLEMQKFK